MKRIVLALMLTACSNNYTVSIPYGEDPAPFQAAADEWNACRKAHIEIVIDDRNADVRAIPMPRQEMMEEHAPPDGATITGLYFKSGTIQYADDLSGTHLTTVIAHEMGHMLGLNHEPDGIMMPETRDGNHVTREDCIRE